MRNGQPVDLAHLDSYTGGNRSLNEEVLRLFETHCRDMLEKLEGAASNQGEKPWREATHTLKGAARGIGAFDLADAAADAEKTAMNDAGGLIAALTRLKAHSAAVQLFIEEFLKRDQ
jgi:HPt (histidine-containing phosphotransfer) domain-containing protein